MSDKYGGWQPVGEALGEGGQGKVYKARSPERVREREQSIQRIRHQIRQLGGVAPQDSTYIEELANRIIDIGSMENPEHLGALKVFTIPKDNPQEREQALGRLQAEMKALQELKHPSILKLLQGCHLAVEEHFIVTEYHPNGTLAGRLDTYKGRAFEALRAFRPLVEAVSAIHGQNAIHRDIKPQNIFVAADERLVLGDFGIVFFADPQRTRLTDTYGEIVGSHWWMAPWAYEDSQLPIEAVNPSLDLYPLGKVLWSMVAGRNGFPHWELKRDKNDLELMFPEDPAMPIVNRILEKCIVREERDCVKSAADLLGWVDSAIEYLRRLGEKPDDPKQQWPCRLCGKGHYVQETKQTFMQYGEPSGAIAGSHRLAMYICDKCRHAEIFRV